MANFMGGIRGSGKETTRLGHKTQGLNVWAKSWNSGVRVFARYNKETEQNEFVIHYWGDDGVEHHIGTVIEQDYPNKPIVTPAYKRS